MATQVGPPTTSIAMPVKLYPSPVPFLDKLDPILGSSGCIRSAQDVSEFVKMMQASQFLVSRCMILNVLKSTKAPSTLSKFMDSGGWTTLNMWLAEAKKAQNVAILVELLQVLKKLPVTVTSLKQGNMGKIIKQMSKSESSEVKSLASDILLKWMTIFREQAAKPATKPTPEATGTLTTPTEERHNSIGGGEDDTPVTSPTQPRPKSNGKKEKKLSGKKKESKQSKVVNTTPIESSQPPPGPMVVLGKPKERLVKRPRDLLSQKGHPPTEKKTKLVADLKGNKGPIESEGFMAFLSHQALAATKLKEKKEKKIKKPSKSSKLTRTNSETMEVTTPTTDTPPMETDQLEASSEDALKKKHVSWAIDDNLTVVHYFELDESERVNVNKQGSFLAAAQQEKMREREALESGLMFSRDRLMEMIPWRAPPQLDTLTDLRPRGGESEEKEKQTKREGKVLAQLFLNKSSVQPSPLEPDPESDIPDQEPKLIPLNEPGAPISQPPMFSPTSHSLPTNHSTPDPPLLSPGTTINQAQSLINFYNEQGSDRGIESRAQEPLLTPPNQGGNGHYPHPHPNQVVERPPQWNPQRGGFFPSGNNDFYRGPPQGMGEMHQEPPGMDRGFPGEFRGMGNGGYPIPRRRVLSGLESKICKHFLTHGCRMGSKCKFLHCTPEDLAKEMNASDQKSFRGFRGGRGYRGNGRGTHWGRGGHTPPHQPSPPHHKQNEMETEQMEVAQKPSEPINSDNVTDSSVELESKS